MQSLKQNKTFRPVLAALFSASLILFLSHVHAVHAQKSKAEVSIKSAEGNTKSKPPSVGYDGSSDINTKTGDETSPSEEKDLFTNYQDPASSTLPNPFYAFLRSLGSLIFILALVYLTIYGLKVFMNKKPGFAFSSNIHVLESVFLSTNKSLHLVEVGGEVLFLGVTEGNMNVLKEIKDPQSLKSLRVKMSTGRLSDTTKAPASSMRTAPPAASFKEALQRAASTFKNAEVKPATGSAAETPPSKTEENIKSSLNILRKELEKIQEIRKKEIS